MTSHTPPTDQELDAIEALAKNVPAAPWTVDDARAELRGSHGNLLADLWDDRLGAYFAALSPDAVRVLVAEVRRLRARQLTASEYNAAWHAVEGAAGQEGADPGTVLHAVLDRLGIEWQTAAHPAAVPAAVAPDTLPAWLHRRFSGTAVTWDALDSDERAYWEHQAAAVRRAVARGGFKTTRPAVRPAVETGARPA